jgi:hypothetical protein
MHAQVAAGAGEVEVAKKLARQSIELARSARSGSLPAGGLNPLFGSTTLTSRTGELQKHLCACRQACIEAHVQ